MKTANVTTYDQEKWKHCICSCSLPSCAFCCAFPFICKHTVVITALLRCCNNIADCLAFKLSVFNQWSSKLHWLVKDVSLLLSSDTCEPCQRNWLCCRKWLISWYFTDGLSQGLFVFSDLHPFSFLANVSEIISLTVAVIPNTTVMSVKENEGNPSCSLSSGPLGNWSLGLQIYLYWWLW